MLKKDARISNLLLMKRRRLVGKFVPGGNDKLEDLLRESHWVSRHSYCSLDIYLIK